MQEHQTKGRDNSRHLKNVVFLVACSLLPAVSSAAPGEPDPLVGQHIYNTGETKEAAAVHLAGPGLKMPSSLFSCKQCHGEDGSGGKEGGISVPNIQYHQLIALSPGKRPTGRTHPAYDKKSLIRAIREGIDPGGNILGHAMPRYHFSEQDMQDLVAYLMTLDNPSVAGVSAASIRVGSLQPNRGPLRKISSQVQKMLRKSVREINRRGGIFGRMIELEIAEFDPRKPHSIEQAMASLLGGNEVFCLVANLGLPINNRVNKILEKYNVPEIGPLRLVAENHYSSNSQSYYLFTSLADQGRILVDYALDKVIGVRSRIALVYSDDPLSRGGARGVRDQLVHNGLIPDLELVFGQGAMDYSIFGDELASNAIDVIYFFGASEQLSGLLGSWNATESPPTVFGSAEITGRLPGLSHLQMQQIYFVSPLVNPSASQTESDRYLKLLKEAGIGKDNSAFVAGTYAAMKLLESGLEAAGRRLNRSSLMSNLNQQWKFKTGVLPELSFSQNRRVGTRGAYIVQLDPAVGRFYRVSDWREPR